MKGGRLLQILSLKMGANLKRGAYLKLGANSSIYGMSEVGYFWKYGIISQPPRRAIQPEIRFENCFYVFDQTYKYSLFH